MIYDLQKASMWKRISAYLCDMILFCIVTVGIAFLLSSALGVNTQQDKMTELCHHYAEEYGLDAFLTKEELDADLFFTISEERYNSLSEENKSAYDEATKALLADQSYLHAYGMVNQLILLVIIFSILATYLVLEFAVPLLFKNGQTVGKKVFGVAVMRIDGVKLSPLLLFVRTILGKYTIETMVPVFVLLMIYLGTTGIVGLAVLLIIALAQIGLLLFTNARTPIHDMMAGTVAVDFASQMIFNSPEEMLEYKKKLHADSVQQSTSNS